MRFLFFIFLIQLGIISNAQIAKEIYLGFDLKNKSEYNKVLMPSKYLINKNNDSPTLLSFPSTHLFLGLMLKEKYGIELGYFREFYFAGAYTKTPDNVLCGGYESVDMVHNYYLYVAYHSPDSETGINFFS